MNYRNCKFEQWTVDYQQVCELLDMCRYAKDSVVFGSPSKDKRLDYRIYIEDNPVNFKITSRILYRPRPITYVFSKKDGLKPDKEITGLDAYRELKKYVEVDNLLKRDDRYTDYTSSPLLFSNYNNTETQIDNCICYDTNLTYFHLLTQKFPDTTRLLGCGIVEEGMVGFEITENRVLGSDMHIREVLKIKKPGRYADFRFYLVDSPFNKYIDFKLQQLKEHPEDRKIIKNSINLSIGMLQHHNPIWRAYIVESGNQRIKDLMDKNSIYCNTDCIVSTKPRDDIKVSKEIGDFKIEHQGTCWINGMNIRWDDGTVKHRGANISNNKYKFNREKLEIEEIK